MNKSECTDGIKYFHCSRKKKPKDIKQQLFAVIVITAYLHNHLRKLGGRKNTEEGV